MKTDDIFLFIHPMIFMYILQNGTIQRQLLNLFSCSMICDCFVLQLIILLKLDFYWLNIVIHSYVLTFSWLIPCYWNLNFFKFS